jgi:hypothetical protein
MSYTIVTREHCINVNNYVLRNLAINLKLLENGQLQTIHQKTSEVIPAIRRITPQVGVLAKKGFTNKFKRDFVRIFKSMPDEAYWIILNEHVSKEHPDAVYSFAYIQHLEEGKTPEESDRMAIICRNAALTSVKEALTGTSVH